MFFFHDTKLDTYFRVQAKPYIGQTDRYKELTEKEFHAAVKKQTLKKDADATMFEEAEKPKKTVRKTKKAEAESA